MTLFKLMGNLLSIACLCLSAAYMGMRLDSAEHDARAADVQGNLASEVEFIVTTYVPGDLAEFVHYVRTGLHPAQAAELPATPPTEQP